MHHIRVEELEPRVLLSDVGLALPGPDASSSIAASVRVCAPPTHPGDQADSAGPERSSSSLCGVIPSEAVAGGSARVYGPWSLGSEDRPAARFEADVRLALRLGPSVAGTRDPDAGVGRFEAQSLPPWLDVDVLGGGGPRGTFDRGDPGESWWVVEAGGFWKAEGLIGDAGGNSPEFLYLTTFCRTVIFAPEAQDFEVGATGARNVAVRSDLPAPTGGAVASDAAPIVVSKAVAAVPVSADPTGGRLPTAPATNVVAAVLSDLATSGTAARLGYVVFPPGIRSEATALAFARLLAGAEADVVPHLVSSWVRGPASASPDGDFIPPAVELDGEPALTAPALPPPLVAGLLTALPPPDVAALERDMQLFLGEVEHLGQRLGADPGTGWGPWIVAGVAAAVACELARRQLKRSVGTGAVGANPLSGSFSHPSLPG